ncbi:MAG: transglutaminase family protein [Pseudomonadales bacterium]|nr:transglutaminase family protein [Pseudomonadales bacterium]
MTIKVALNHNTEYRFDKPVTVHPHVVRLRPSPHCRTPILAYSLKVSPEDHFVNWQQDPFGNYLARYVFAEKTRELLIRVELIAELTVINPFDFFLEEIAEKFPFRYPAQLVKDLGPYLEVTERGKLLEEFVGAVDLTPRGTVDFLVDLNRRVQQHVGYVIRFEPGVQTCEETLKLRLGSCRDSAWLLVQILRRLGLAARFVSGYLIQLTADEKSLDGPSGPEQDFTDLHAWTEVFLPGAGWIGLDPTSGLFAGEGHIPLACTPDPVSAAAVTGATGPAEVDFHYENRVTRIFEDPRVTKPYDDSQWPAVEKLAAQVDAELEAGDVRLTMGGEPTFVSIDDMEGAQWNTAALGKEKRKLAGDLFMKLRKRFGAGGLVHVGQGKWYPGEPLPRWALSLIWRDDEVLWGHEDLIGDESKPGKADGELARQFAERFTAAMGIDTDYLVAGYEDVAYYAWREGQLPVNLGPDNNQIDDPLERERIRRIFAEGLGKAVGYALPLKWHEVDEIKGYWKTSAWTFRNEYMFLVPGDSPMGFRLPLSALPWKKPNRTEFDAPADPFWQQPGVIEAVGPAREDSEVLHTAMCFEVRSGHLYVFMPPVTRFAVYAALVNVVEGVAAELGCPVILEGYEAPRDAGVSLLQITPDPGVIEVNVHPSKNWRELASIIDGIYADARESRLGTEKFMVDGRHTGTGGGNHVTLGGATPADSPFLRRPELLKSLILYWQNHPALSYLFSGMFIGPTSQSPRVDEARDDNLYELEIALARIPEGECQQPWLVDRLLRNFLIDLTGNTHRAEFCIDKLYSPDTSSGRRGLVEFRAFEMPPHSRMSLVQMLLMRALIAMFWRRPYEGRLIRWGTELHDKFMLRHFIVEDMRQVIDDLNRAGYAFDLAWFDPFIEFRFPRIGGIHLGDLHLELFTALEPWHVLGEEATGQGTARYVDSTVERIQVTLDNAVADRYVVTCNGRRVPLRVTGTRGKQVGAVRFKAWEASSSLHPTVSTHNPLIFDVVDVLNKRSLGGCTYYVSHPGGRNYETYPVNAAEAEARRNARFWEIGKTQGAIRAPKDETRPEQPLTLDLRWPDPN